MPNIWFTADFHLGHKNIVRHCNRPFDTVEEMNRTIIERLNSLVKTAEVSINGQRIVLCHYAMRVWNHSSHGAWHLYGHSHGRLPSVDASLSMVCESCVRS